MTPIYVEFLKLRRSKILWVVLAAPFIVGLLFFLLQMSGNSLRVWPLHMYAGFGAWAYFMLPMTATVIATLMIQLEHAPKTWAHLFVLPVPKWRIFAAKICVTLFLMALMSLLVAGFMGLGGWLGGELRPETKLINPDSLRPLLDGIANQASGEGNDVSFGGSIDAILGTDDWRMALAKRLGLIYLSSFLLIAIQLWAAILFRQFLIPMSIGVGGGFVAVVAQASEYGIYFPWLLPVNMLQTDEARITIALSLGLGGGLLAFLAMIVTASRMEIK